LDLIGLTNLLSAADNFTSDGTYMVLGDNLVTDNILCHKKEAIMNHIERSIVIFQENLEREEGTEFQEVVNRLKVFHFFFVALPVGDLNCVSVFNLWASHKKTHFNS
jgi:hypothetical protein